MALKGQTMKKRVVPGSVVIVWGLCLFLCLSPVRGRGEQLPPEGCPPLPEQGPANQVSVYVAQALYAPGAVCARVINGFSSSIVGAVGYLRLQKWEEGRFRDLDEILSGGAPVLMTADRPAMPPGAIIEHRLPLYGQPAPPGRYRVCFGYIPPGQDDLQWTCSEEFSLP
jgi:hypothetical protein